MFDRARHLVLTTVDGTPHLPRNIARTFTTATQKLGHDHWQPHERRHTAASLMFEAGIPLETIADQLGHDGTRMTQRLLGRRVAGRKSP